MRNKILFFVDDYSGGAGNVVQILANEFEKMPDFCPVVAILNPHSSKYKLSGSIQTVEYKMSDNKSDNKLIFLRRNLKTIRKIVADIKPDGIISFLDNINTNVCLSLFFNKIPIIVCERSNPLAIKPYGLYRYLRPLAYLRANKISVQCECFKEFMPCMKSKMIVTPNPVSKPPIIKTDYAINGPIKFISCARLAEIKQFDLMIKAFAKIHSQLNNSILTIYGNGPQRDYLSSLADKLGLNDCVYLPGATNNIYEKLSTADIYLMTSRQEGFPNALCEAMAVGLPVVAFECHQGLRDIIDNGINGFLIQADDVDDMCSLALRLTSDDSLRKRVGNEAKNVVEKFSTAKICSLWERLVNHEINK